MITYITKRILFTLSAVVAFAAVAYGFDYKSGRASLSPYPDNVEMAAYPDTLTPVFLNHVGRHGSRYPASSVHVMMMKRALDKADSLKTITPLGKEFKKEVERVITETNGRWGELDVIGEKEHRSIAARAYRKYPQLFDSAQVSAISSYSPRSIMSMYSFTHQLSKMTKNISITASSGKGFNALMRNFDEDEAYKQFRADTAYSSAYRRFAADNVPVEPLLRILGENFPFDYDKIYDLALAEYYVAAGMNAMGLEFDASKYFSVEEYRKLWSTFNFRQYLLYSASVLSSRPAEIAAPLLQDIVSTADAVVSGRQKIKAKLRFGHAETLMPLMSLLHAPGCYYLTNYFDTVAENWKDFEMFPMAANLQLVYFKSDSGEIYVRAEYNEKAIKLLPDVDSEFVRWSDLRTRMLELLPLE